MTEFEWNGLRVGDRVLVHEPLGRDDFPLHPGVVVMVDASSRAHALGVRVAAGSSTPSAIEWPRRLEVHADPMDPVERCWRCQLVAG